MVNTAVGEDTRISAVANDTCHGRVTPYAVHQIRNARLASRVLDKKEARCSRDIGLLVVRCEWLGELPERLQPRDQIGNLLSSQSFVQALWHDGNR